MLAAVLQNSPGSPPTKSRRVPSDGEMCGSSVQCGPVLFSAFLLLLEADGHWKLSPCCPKLLLPLIVPPTSVGRQRCYLFPCVVGVSCGSDLYFMVVVSKLCPEETQGIAAAYLGSYGPFQYSREARGRSTSAGCCWTFSLGQFMAQ